MHYQLSNDRKAINELRRRQSMTRYWKYSALVLMALAIFVPVASAHPRVFIGGGFYGPTFYAPGYYGWYGPTYGAPYAVEQGPYEGKVKFDTKMKDALDYVDNAYAGTVWQLGTFPLRPGAHNVELRDPSGQVIFQQRIDVLAGKTLKLNA
jgi:hypothetical protein